jgi:2-O-methyltransferase
MRFVFLVFLSLSGWFTSLQANTYPPKVEGSFAGWNQKRLDLISLFLPINPVVIQAGGHYGIETVSFAQRWPNGKIISFEPNPHAFEILSSKTSSSTNVQVYNSALNNYSGNAPFYLCYGSSGKDPAFEHASSLLKPSAGMEIHYQGPVITVDCVLLDEWCYEHQIDHVDFLCLNLQGAELQVLKSSPEILKSVTCISVHTNLFPFRKGTTHYVDLKNFLEKSGFQLLTHWYREGLDGDAIFVKKSYFLNNATQEFMDTHGIDETYRRYYEPFFKTYYDLDDNGDTIKKTLKQGHAYEGNIGLILKELTKPGSVVLDIGSHIGVHTVTMSKKAGPQGAVIAFEPNKKLYMELLNTLNINGCGNVISIAKGLSDRPQTVILNNIRIEQDINERTSGDLIETIALDSLNLNNLSLIKMDVENYEYFVLKGAKETILRNKPVIVFECWIGADYNNSNPKEKANFDRVISLIESYGYEIHIIYSNDFIAFPNEATGELLEFKKRFKKLDLNNFDLGL